MHSSPAVDKTALTNLMSSIVASRTAMFAHLQDLNDLIGGEVDPHELCSNIDCNMPGRADVTTAEAESLLAARGLGSWDADDIIQAAQLPQHRTGPSNPDA